MVSTVREHFVHHPESIWNIKITYITLTTSTTRNCPVAVVTDTDVDLYVCVYGGEGIELTLYN